MTKTQLIAPATPLPWHLGGAGTIHDKVARFDEHGARHGDTPNRILKVEYPYGDDAGKEANALYVWTACNAFPGLVSALRIAEAEMTLLLPYLGGIYKDSITKARDNIRAELDKLKQGA